jgi:hypothetical protein
VDSLTKRLHKIQNQYFPRWDINHKYRIEKWDLLGARCDYKAKLIQVSDVNDELVIIHEICHAVVAKGLHGPDFQNRFLKVAAVADSLGKPKLAKDIRDDVDWIRNQFKDQPERRLTAREVSCEINDAAIDAPNISFEDIVKYVARENAMFPEELLKYYPKSLRRAFDSAHSLIEANRALKQKLGI